MGPNGRRCYKGPIYGIETSYSRSDSPSSVSRVGPTGTDAKNIHGQVHVLNETVQRQLEEADKRYMSCMSTTRGTRSTGRSRYNSWNKE